MENSTLAATLRNASGSAATYESFARSLMEQILKTASEHAERNQQNSASADKIAFDLPVTVQSSVAGRGCIVVCIRGAGCFRWCPND